MITALSSEAPSDMIALASRAGILKPTTGERCVLNSSVATGTAFRGQGCPQTPYALRWAR